MAQFRTRKTPLDGVLLIDKPEGFTSHDVVARVRRRLRPAVKKVGHAGTLDPFATGLLVVLVGRATKLARFFVDVLSIATILIYRRWLAIDDHMIWNYRHRLEQVAVARNAEKKSMTSWRVQLAGMIKGPLRRR